MTRSVALIFLLLLTAAAGAQEQYADLAPALELLSVPERPKPGDIVTWRTSIENRGPHPARRARIESWLDVPRETCTSQTFAELQPGERRVFECSAELPRALSVVIRTIVSSDTSDPDPTNNYVADGFPLVTPPDLRVHTYAPPVVDAALPFTIRVSCSNLSYVVATGAKLQIEIPGIAGVLKMPGNCTANGSRIDCAIGNVDIFDAAGFIDLWFDLLAPDQPAQRLTVAASIYGNEEDLQPDSNFEMRDTKTYRTFFVTNTADSGSGSLREAISSSNAACTDGWPCKVAFRIPPAGAKWMTIRPESALPMVTGQHVWIDGATQAAYFGDTNPDGPEIEISGANVREGSGIHTTAPCDLVIQSLAINGFPANGVEVHGGSACSQQPVWGIGMREVRHCYIGTDPTGTVAIPNSRGVVADLTFLHVHDNVISGNARSGVFTNSAYAVIGHNVIGLTAGAKAPLGNGASGVYLGPRSSGSDVFNNYLGFNAHFGISLHPDNSFNAFGANSFQANGNLAIDYGLDGPTESVPDPSASEVKMPLISSARYDAIAGETVIEGSSETLNARHEVWVNLYANDEPDSSGYGEGQYYLGAAKCDSNMRFRFTMKGRPPGRWIAGTTTRINIVGWAKAPTPNTFTGSGWAITTGEFGRTVALLE